MTPLRLVMLGATALALSVAACDQDLLLEDLTPTPDAGPDDAATMPEPDAGIADAEADAPAVPADAAPSSCSIDGFCWTTLPPKQTLRGVWSDAAGSAWAVTSQGTVLRWDGATWTIQWTAPGALAAVWGSGPTDVWIGGEKGLFHGEGATPGSMTWTAVPFDPALPVVDIAGSGPNDVWAIGNRLDYSTSPAELRSLVRHFTGGEPNAEASWAVDPISFRPGLARKILVRPNRDAWLAGDWDGRYPISPAYVLRREAAGAGDPTWIEATMPVEGNDFIASVSGGGFVGNAVWILGWRGSSRVTSSWFGVPGPASGTETWAEERTPVSIHRHYAVWGTSKNDVYLAGAFGRLRHYDGTSWRYARISIDGLPVVSDFFSSFVNPDSELWLVGDNVALHKKLSP